MLEPDDLLDDETATAPKAKASRRVQRNEPFTRVPMRWIEDSRFGARERLLLALWDEAHESDREFKLIAEVWHPAHMSRRMKSRLLREFEEEGIITVKRNGNRAPLIKFRDKLR
jgi:hypothetical protein